MKAKRALTALGILFTAAMLLAFPHRRRRGRQGLALCAEVVVPTLFPFMALSGFWHYPAWGIFCLAAAAHNPLLLRLPDQAAGAVLMGLIGGLSGRRQDHCRTLAPGSSRQKRLNGCSAAQLMRGRAFWYRQWGAPCSAALRWAGYCCWDR